MDLGFCFLNGRTHISKNNGQTEESQRNIVVAGLMREDTFLWDFPIEATDEVGNGKCRHEAQILWSLPSQACLWTKAGLHTAKLHSVAYLTYSTRKRVKQPIGEKLPLT